jgi:hypothetical protein
MQSMLVGIRKPQDRPIYWPPHHQILDYLSFEPTVIRRLGALITCLRQGNIKVGPDSTAFALDVAEI